MNTDDVRAAYLVAYDTQLRTEAETRWAQSVTRLGPLWLCRRPGNGFITYRNLAGMADLNDLVGKALATFATDPDVIEVEWKTRGHDHAPGLADALAAHGFVAGEPESIMIGEAAGLDVPIALPPGVTVRAVTAPEDVRAASLLADEVFDTTPDEAMARTMAARVADDPALQVWAAFAGDEVIGSGRVEGVPGTDFAGLWGGITRPQWRGQGIYRALTAGRARAALAMGHRLLHSDSTAFSRPILERNGLRRVSTTTPYTWRRPAR